MEDVVMYDELLHLLYLNSWEFFKCILEKSENALSKVSYSFVVLGSPFLDRYCRWFISSHFEESQVGS